MKIGDQVLTADRFENPGPRTLVTSSWWPGGRRRHVLGVIVARHHVRDVYDVQHLTNNEIAAYHADELTVVRP